MAADMTGDFVFFFNDTATTEIYTLSLHDALPICPSTAKSTRTLGTPWARPPPRPHSSKDRKSTRLNSSHANISYAVFCLKKKNRTTTGIHTPRKNFTSPGEVRKRDALTARKSRSN